MRTANIIASLTVLSIFCFIQPANAAGGGGTVTPDTTNSNLGNGTNNLNNLGVNNQPLYQPNPNQNGFSYSQQLSGYGITNGCGTQLSIGTNYLNSTSPYSNNNPGNSITNNYTIGANLIFNSQPCSDLNKQLDIQMKQVQLQKDTICIQERNKFATTIFTANPKITLIELDKMLDVVCR